MKTTKDTKSAKKATAATLKTKANVKKNPVVSDNVCTCDICLANTQAARLNRDFKNAVFVVSLGVNLILITLIITAMVSETYARQLGQLF